MNDVEPLLSREAKSPFRANTQFVTPMKQEIDKTPKKSLLKRFLESATPSKNHQPRIINIDSKNVTSTIYTNPQECINQIKVILLSKGIRFKLKE